MRLTKTVVEGIEEKQILWDDGVRGFGVRRQKRDRIYIVRYRWNGEQRQHRIGLHGDLTVEQARREAQRIRGLVATGIDPTAEPKTERTFFSLIEAHLTHCERTLRPGSLRMRRFYLLTHWAKLHQRPLNEISRRDVAEILEGLAAHPSLMLDTRSALSSFFGWAVQAGHTETNPVLRTFRPKAVQRDHVLSEFELCKVWKHSGEDQFGRIVKIMILTACRREEIGGMRWSEMRNGVFYLPKERSKNHIEHQLPLLEPVLHLLPERTRSPFVFPVLDHGFVSWAAEKKKLDERCGLRGWQLRDLRRTASTMMGNLGIAPHIIEQILNHSRGSVYNRSKYEKDVRAALEVWTAEVLQICGG